MKENKNRDYVTVKLDKEMQESYIVYAVSILERAIPSVFDGCKNVQRRIMWTMCEMNTPKLRKSATIVGEVMGKYHPHGDSAIYQTIVRLSQDFVMLHPLIYGHGNFGSIDGDGAAAMRYTEIKLENLSYHLFDDIYENTVDFRANYDGNYKEPVLLPSKFPNLLINGAQGIAVGYSTSIPSHNLKEVIQATKYLLNNPECTIDDLLNFVQGPDFPTGGILSSKEAIHNAYRTGDGIVKIRGKVILEGDNRIIITEIPYQLTKSNLLEKIIQEVKNGKIENVHSVRDESDNHIRIVIELKKNATIEVTLNQLYTFTPLLSSYKIYLLALNEEGKPQLFNLKSMLKSFLEFRHEVISRKTVFNLGEYERRINILFGYIIALDNLEELVNMVTNSENTENLKQQLTTKKWTSHTLSEYMKDVTEIFVNEFILNKEQMKSILEMRLQNLTKMEKNKIINEINELRKLITEKRKILTDVNLRNEIIEKELTHIEDKFSKPRYTQIEENYTILNDEDFIPKEDMVITLSKEGFVKRTPLNLYKEQRRGGKGSLGFNNQANDEDIVNNILVANTHDILLLFTTNGIVFSLKTYKIPVASKNSKGRFTSNFIKLDENDKIIKILPLTLENQEKRNIFFVTNLGHVRKNSLKEFANLRADGKIYMKFSDNERLINICFCDDETEIMLFTKNGKAIRFDVTGVREFASRSSVGVRGCNLEKNDEVVSLISNHKNSTEIPLIFTITANGFGKCTKLENYRKTKRGAKGVINIKLSPKDHVLGVESIYKDVKNNEYDDIIVVTNIGQTLRCSVEEIRNSARSTKGVRVINIEKNDKVVSIAKFKEEKNEASEQK